MTLFQTVLQQHTKKTKFPLRTSTSTKEDEALQYIHSLEEKASALKVEHKLRRMQQTQTAEELCAWADFLLPLSSQTKYRQFCIILIHFMYIKKICRFYAVLIIVRVLQPALETTTHDDKKLKDGFCFVLFWIYNYLYMLFKH